MISVYFYELSPDFFPYLPKTEGNPYAYGNFSWPELAKTI